MVAAWEAMTWTRGFTKYLFRLNLVGGVGLGRLALEGCLGPLSFLFFPVRKR